MLWWSVLPHLVGLHLAGLPLVGLHLVGPDAGAAGVLAAATLCALLLVVATLAVRLLTGGTAPGPVPGSPRRAVRDGLPRHRDPDAAGRARPRAPTAVATTA
jgi:hypothetical protein